MDTYMNVGEAVIQIEKSGYLYLLSALMVQSLLFNHQWGMTFTSNLESNHYFQHFLLLCHLKLVNTL